MTAAGPLQPINSARASLGEELLAIGPPIPDAIAPFDGLLSELAMACREDKPLPCSNDAPPPIPSDALCSLGEIRTYSDLCEVRDALQAIAAQEHKFLRRLRRDKQVEKRRHDLERRFHRSPTGEGVIGRGGRRLLRQGNGAG